MSERILGRGAELQLPQPQRAALDRALQRADGHEPADRLAVSRAALGLLRGLASEGTLVVAIDDVQWLDTPTEHVLAFALRRLADVRARALIACRGAGGAAPLGLRGAVQVGVDPLPPSELGALLQDRLGLDLARPRLLELHRACGGNPLFALEIGRALKREHGAADRLPVPDSLGGLLALRLETLSAAARDATLLTAAAAQPTWTLIERAAERTDWQRPSGPHRQRPAHFPAAGTATIAVQLTAAGRKEVLRAKRLALTAKGTFTPASAAPVSATRSFTLRR